MDKAEKSNQVLPTPSRTLRISSSGYNTNNYEYEYILNGNVYFLLFDTVEEAVKAYERLKEDKVPVRYHVYSLFVKFDQVVTEDNLEIRVNEILSSTNSSYNITYLRTDTNNKESHTGKVVVDKLDDCRSLLTFKDESSVRLRFYRFDPKKAVKKNTSNDGFKMVIRKKKPVQTNQRK